MPKASFGLTPRSFSFRATLTIVAMAALGVVLTGFVSWYTLSREIDQTLEMRTKWSLRVAAEAFISYYPQFTLAYDKQGEVVALRGPAIADFVDHDAVDRVSRINKGTATVFRYDAEKNDFIRLTTSVKKADGSRAVGTVLGNTGVVFPVIMRGEVFRGVAHILGIPYQTGYMPIYSGSEKPSGILYIGVGKIDELRASTDVLYAQLLLACGVVLAFASLCGFIIARRMVAPVAILAGATERIAGGQVEKDIGFADRPDEIGQLARAVQRLNSFVIERAEFQMELQRKSETDQSRAARLEDAINAFRIQIKEALTGLRDGATRTEQASSQIAEMIEVNQASSHESGSSARETSVGINEVAAASQQLSRAIQEVSTRAGETSRIVHQAVSIGEDSRDNLSELSLAADKIGQVVGVIRVIAEQTNLLALNATIEAARAGEAGRGFAVVAGEVKQLADQTSRATNEVADQVTSIQTVSQSVISGFATLLEALAEINHASVTISAAVEEQGIATQSIARSASIASSSASKLDSSVGTISASLTSSGQTVATFSAISSQLHRQAENINQTVDGFLLKVAS